MKIKGFLILLGFILALVCVVFSQFLLKGYLPIPSDSLVGLYHPFRDLYATEYPNGVPFKNFLITDPVRQQYPWRFLAVDELKHFSIPLWNPYALSGTPLLANMQSAPLYPLNVLFFILPFSFAWSLLVFLQPILMGVFLYLYLRVMRVSIIASIFGSTAYASSGFSVSWMEWNTVIHTAFWLPLVLLSIEKIFAKFSDENSKLKTQNSKLQLKIKNHFFWSLILVFSLSSSLFAGHLQTFFYLFLVTLVYIFLRWLQLGKDKKSLILFTVCFLLFAFITLIQWVPTIQFISYSARDVDQALWTQPGWFIPWEHLVQFVAPDFFGNPTTLNYFGTWNYAELVGYIGIIPFVFALYAMIQLRNRQTLFFVGVLVLSLLFAFDNFLARLPFVLSIPFISTSQPTRLLFLIDFSLAVLAALGLDAFRKNRHSFIKPLLVISIVVVGLWVIVIFNVFSLSLDNLMVSKRNLFLPTAFFGILSFAYVISVFVKGKYILYLFFAIIFLATSIDLIRFSQKFLPFSTPLYLYPQTGVLTFLQSQEGFFRIMSTDSRILPPNVSLVYKLQTIEGYDPLYLRRYGELISASERGRPDISPPFGFNRIITPHKYESPIIDLLGVRYILSLDELDSKKLVKVYEEGQTKIYENSRVFPQAFSVQHIIQASSKENAIKEIFSLNDQMINTAVVEEYVEENKEFGNAQVEIYLKEANYIKLSVKSDSDADSFIVLMDSYYPTWKAYVIINNENVPLQIYRTNYNFRGIVVPGGDHVVEFHNSIF